jgi:plasmid stabilization system protein ParE
MERIGENPEGGSPFAQLTARRVLVPGFPYQIVYRLDSDDIRVIAIAHLRRRPGFWRHRR